MQSPCIVSSARQGLWVQTRVNGRVTGGDIDLMVEDFRRLRAGEVWLIDGSTATSYAPDAVARAAERFGTLATTEGLRKIVAYLLSPTVRMGASVVSMMLRTVRSSLEIEIVEDVMTFRQRANTATLR